MKLTWGLRLIAILGMVVISCLDPPQYSTIPEIVFDQVIFKDVKDPSSSDTLIVSIKFKDGDGNIGIAPSELQEPFNDKFYVQLPERAFVSTYVSSKTYVTYKTKRTVVGYDTLPAFVKPYNCSNWEVITQGQKITDTLYFQLNPNYNNIFITFQTRDASGKFQNFDWTNYYTYPQCEVRGFSGRIPVLSKDSQPIPLEGTIRYSMKSPFFKTIFNKQALKLKIQIQDRALNKSNIIETGVFTL